MRRNKPEKQPEPEKVVEAPKPPLPPERYRLVGSGVSKDMVVEVNALIQEGWKPLGSPMYAGGVVIQAMTKD